MSETSNPNSWLEQAVRDAYTSIARQYDEANAALDRHPAARHAPARSEYAARAPVPSAPASTTAGAERATTEGKAEAASASPPADP
ncbi:MAG: hypothetical protein GEU98_14655 [Pseudonocardiaceae bacterium]|nr:hypothetical protein [Pseudonocardiaceae bacterium]